MSVVCLCYWQVCVRTMAKCDTILPLIAAMKIRPDCTGMAAETMRKMFDLNIPELVVQVSVIICVMMCVYNNIYKHVHNTHT